MTPGDLPWPVLRTYDQNHLTRLALPLGGIGTGTVSLSGRGQLRDWEIVNRPAKGFNPRSFFAIFTRVGDEPPIARALEGPLDPNDYEGKGFGSEASNHGLPRFRDCSFAAAYPFGQVFLSDPEVPVSARIKAFNPLVPADADASGTPAAIFRIVVTNTAARPVAVSVCSSIQNFIGRDGGSNGGESRGNVNRYRREAGLHGLYLNSEGVDPDAEAWGTMALTTPVMDGVSHRTAWLKAGWGSSPLDFWDDFSSDGVLEERESGGEKSPMASLAVSLELAPGATASIPFFITWHFPNRYTWTKAGDACCATADRIGNYYTTQFHDAWDVAEQLVGRVDDLEAKTLRFVSAFCGTDLPDVVKEAALFNLSTLRSQTCFRTPDGNLYGWEGCGDRSGCCHGSCTHVWNYEQATPFLFGSLARTMRNVEFLHATNAEGMMNFRVNLPIERAREFDKAAADGQLGCLMKLYREWQLSGDTEWLKGLWPQARKALEFCWIPGGWDADGDGVMEGCQHNTMDVEYYGPNPQMGSWYLGALRAMADMAGHLGEGDFASQCHQLFERGRQWIDAHLFNGEYYEQEVRPPGGGCVAEALRLGPDASGTTEPDHQLAAGCLVDQLVGQFMGHVCGLGYLLDAGNVGTTLQSIFRYNRRESFFGHYNCMRSFVLGDESALLMASYPKGRPRNPFPYFTEAMTGFEYTAAVGMLFEGQTEAGLRCIQDIRNRYDGLKRNPFDEAECGHHYARAMASWGAVLALTGFHYSAVSGDLTVAAKEGRFFWSTGYAWGEYTVRANGDAYVVDLNVLFGKLALSAITVREIGRCTLDQPGTVAAGANLKAGVRRL